MMGQDNHTAIGACLGQMPTMTDMIPVLLTGAGLIVAMLGLFFLAAWLRKRYWLERDVADNSQLSVENLQRLHDQGQLSDEEFSKLRRLALGLGPKKGSGELTPGPKGDDLSNYGGPADRGGPPRE